jgi:[acyl-carrier-protein] S-malonyltransferase
MTRVYLFPGQGSQSIGMGRAIAEAYPAAMDTFREAEDVLGLKIRELCWEGSEDTLRETQNAQVALFVTSLAALRAWQAAGGPEPHFVAGHSLGEYSAVCAAGALDFATTLRLVRLRGELMARAEAGTMAAILGLEAANLEGICAEVAGTVVVANYNSPDQLVVSGSPEAVAEAGRLAAERGAKRVVPLAVAGAFHSPLMTVASAELTAALAAAPWQDANVPVITNVDATATTEASAFADKLSRQLASPVLWSDAMRWALSRGEVTFVEMGAGKVLSGLVKKLDRKAPTLATEDPEAMQKALSALSAEVPV